ELVQQLQKAFPENNFLLTGAMRRQNETIEFAEIVSDLDETSLAQQFETVPDTVIELEPNHRLTVRMPGHPIIKFYLTSTAAVYHTLFITTGSDEFLSHFLSKYQLPETPESEEAIFAGNK